MKKLILIAIIIASGHTTSHAQSILNKLNIQTNGDVYALAVDEVNSILYLGGRFTEVGGFNRNNLAAIDLSTHTVTSWNPNLNNVVYSLFVFSGNLYAGGEFTSIGSAVRNRIAAFDLSNGALTAWNPSVDNGWVNTITGHESTVYIGGGFTQVNSLVRNYLAPLDASTGVSAWGAPIDGEVWRLEKYFDPSISEIVIAMGGDFENVGFALTSLASFFPIEGWQNAQFELNFPLSITGQVFAIAVVGDYKIVGGTINGPNADDLIVVRYPDMSKWTKASSNAFRAIASDGNIVYAGGGTSGGTSSHIKGYHISNGVENGWTPGTNGTVYAIAITNGTVYVGGSFTSFNGASQRGIAGVSFLLQPQTISFESLPTKILGEESLILSATSSSGLPVSYTSSDPSIASISGNNVLIHQAGTVTITASQQGNDYFEAATSVGQTLTIKEPSNFSYILFNNLFSTPSNLNYKNHIGGSGLAVGLLELWDDDAITPRDNLSTTLTSISFDILNGNSIYKVGLYDDDFTTKLSEGLLVGNSISFSNLNVTAGVGSHHSLVLKVWFNEVVVDNQQFQFVINHATAHPLGSQLKESIYVGSATDTGGDKNRIEVVADRLMFVQQPSATQISAQMQPPVSIKAIDTYGNLDLDFNQNVSISSSGILQDTPVMVALNQGYGSASNIVHTTSGTGLHLTASFIGFSDVISEDFDVTKINQSIVFEALPDKTIGDPVFNLTATASSGLPVNYTSPSSKIAISGSLITMLQAGYITILANQPGNEQFNSATEVSQSFCINPTKPTIKLSGNNEEIAILTSSSNTGNQWSRNGTSINGATNPTYSINEPGIYTVSVTVDNCISEISNGYNLVITAVDNVEESFTVYPNPVNEVLHLVLPGNSVNETEIVVYDLQGRVRENISTSLAELDIVVKEYAVGTYILFIAHSNTVHHLKFLKK